MTLTDEQLALQECTREFVRREVEPHLQEWEDAGEIPRSLLDSIALQEALFEAGGSSPFGKPLISRQVVRHKLVEMHRQLESARVCTP